MARIIIVRHGESVANVAGRFTTDSAEPLTELGRQQARATGEEIRNRFSPSALYASPFRRALETAELIGEILSITPEVIDDLREQDFGIYRGQPYATFYGQYPAGSVERWEHRPAGGEKLRDVARRAGPVLDRLARLHIDEEIVVVSHGGVMAALRGWITDDYDRPPISTVNARGFVLDFDGKSFAPAVDLDALCDRAPGGTHPSCG